MSLRGWHFREVALVSALNDALLPADHTGAIVLCYFQCRFERIVIVHFVPEDQWSYRGQWESNVFPHQCQKMFLYYDNSSSRIKCVSMKFPSLLVPPSSTNCIANINRQHSSLTQRKKTDTQLLLALHPERVPESRWEASKIWRWSRDGPVW